MPALRMRAGHVFPPVWLRLAVLSVVLACELAAPAPWADESLLSQRSRDGQGVYRGHVEDAAVPPFRHAASRSRCTAVLRDNVVLRRSLARVAASLAASEARADTLAQKLRASNRRASRLLRLRLGGTPGAAGPTAESFPASIPQPAAAGSVDATSPARRTVKPDEIPYPMPLPVSGAQPLHGYTATRCHGLGQ
jgi:hypothetical protein